MITRNHIILYSNYYYISKCRCRSTLPSCMNALLGYVPNTELTHSFIHIYISRYIDALLHNKINILYFYINLFNIFCYGKRLKAGKCRTTLSSILTVRVCVRVDDAIVNHITIHKYTAIHTRATMNMRIYSHRMQRVVMFNEIKYYIF